MKSPVSIAFGQVVREFRERLELSQEALAHNGGVHRTYVSMIERGVRHPTLDIVFRLADGLGVPPSKLVAATEAAIEDETGAG